MKQILEAAEQKLAEALPHVVAFEGSFHGYSLGARSLLAGGKNRLFSPMTRLVRVELPRSDDVDVESFLAAHDLMLPALAEENGKVIESEERFSSIIAAIYEPIRGEGGISETPNALVRQLEHREFPLIADEISVASDGPVPFSPPQVSMQIITCSLRRWAADRQNLRLAD